MNLAGNANEIIIFMALENLASRCVHVSRIVTCFYPILCGTVLAFSMSSGNQPLRGPMLIAFVFLKLSTSIKHVRSLLK